MRDWQQIIAALERKAANGACPAPEREALLAKIAQLRIEHPPATARRPQHIIWRGTTTTAGSATITFTFTARTG